MKKEQMLLLILLVFSLSLFSLTEASIPDNYSEENAGSEENPYKISNLANLRWLSETQEVWGTEEQTFYFIQTADIDASETQNWNNNEGFSPIGINHYNIETDEFLTIPFYGVYNGDDYHIENLFITPVLESNISKNGALFGYAKNGDIRNLNLQNAYVKAQTSAILIAQAINIMVKNCFTSGIVTSNTGLAGNVGGLIGYASSVQVDMCYSEATVTMLSETSSAGGLVGMLVNQSIIVNSYFMGSLFGYGYLAKLGGIAGGCYNSSIDKCYVTSSEIFSTASGIVGFVMDSLIMSCFWDTETTGTNNAYNDSLNSVITATGLSSAEMKNIQNYINSGWDFESIWSISPDINRGYPHFNSITSITDDMIVDLQKDSIVYPNPVNGGDVNFKTSIADKDTEISIYNIKGQLVKTSKAFQEKDNESVFTWNKKNNQNQSVASGVYFYKIKTDDKVKTGKFLIMK